VAGGFRGGGQARGVAVTASEAERREPHKRAAAERAVELVRSGMVVGLGTGSLACQTQPGDLLHYYEIDRAVVRIALDPNRFSYLASCAPNPTIIVGDARLTLADAKDGFYDVLIIDAFSSDAIPTHLLTQEAMAMYVKKLTADGFILVHVSNKHMKLAPVVAGIAEANDLVARVNESEEGTDDDSHKFGSTVVAVARKHEDFGLLAKSEEWKEEEADPEQWVWTDDYSNVLGAMIKQMREE
jgi:spermidine synthase